MKPELLNLVKSDWRPYEKFPDLSGAPLVSFDVETYDPRLMDCGPGAIRKDGYVCGFSVATPDGFTGYYPIRHAEGDNLPNPDGAIRWLRDQLKGNIPKLGANILYDLIWLRCDLGITVGGKKYDVQIAEPLLDENKFTYTLDSLSRQYLGETKVEQLLYEAGIYILGIKPGPKAVTEEEKRTDVIKKVKTRLWELPARYVGPYGEGDASLPIEIFKRQKIKLEEVGLWKLFDEVETPLVDLLLNMWIKGIPVDVERGERAYEDLQLRYDKEMRSIKRRVGFIPDVWAQEDIVRCCEKLSLDYPKTKKGNPSFKAEWLAENGHPFFTSLLRARQLDRSGAVFIKSKILDLEVNGRIHPQFWQVKSDRYGTESGRFSSSNPNAQQFPARNEELAAIVRSILCAEPGKFWGKFDYSQQEFRITVHYANLLKLTGVDKVVKRYWEDPDTDFHQVVADITGLVRRIAKSINLGLTYGMGKKKFSEKYRIPYSDACKYIDLYHQELPFVKQLINRTDLTAKERGVVKTLLGRHCHFDLYGPPRYEDGMIPKKYDEALAEFGPPVVRYFTYKALNRISQGGGADMVKKAMLDCYSAGYVPSITVHDELDFCDLENNKQVSEIHDIMVDAIRLAVPNKVDVAVGNNWGELEETF